MKTLLTPAILTSYRPRSDGGMSLTFTTQEMDEAQIMQVVSNYQQFGWCGFVASEDATDLEIPDEAPSDDRKSLSERLRAVQFVYYKKKYGDTSGFNEWRNKATESIIESYKSRIDELS